ncbi:MAG TPA: NlpC/P60 family protein [Caulobacteraceae bacterium]
MSADPRLTLARADLASVELEGTVRAARFAEPKRMRLTAPSTPLRSARDSRAEQVDQVLFGEPFDVLDADGAFAWGQAVRDGYVGWVDASSLAPSAEEEEETPTHWVTALRTFAFASPSIKSPAFGPLSLNALVRVTGEQGEMALAEGAGWIPQGHLTPIGAGFAEPAATAERFLGTPYLWGGRDSVGIDCSGLIQQALYAGGLACPRDSDLQARLGAPVERGNLARADLVFWRGHVGMMLDKTRLIHANAWHMAVEIEPLAEAVERISRRGGGEPTAFRRVGILHPSPSGEGVAP